MIFPIQLFNSQNFRFKKIYKWTLNKLVLRVFFIRYEFLGPNMNPCAKFAPFRFYKSVM